LEEVLCLYREDEANVTGVGIHVNDDSAAFTLGSKMVGGPGLLIEFSNDSTVITGKGPEIEKYCDLFFV